MPKKFKYIKKFNKEYQAQTSRTYFGLDHQAVKTGSKVGRPT